MYNCANISLIFKTSSTSSSVKSSTFTQLMQDDVETEQCTYSAESCIDFEKFETEYFQNISVFSWVIPEILQRIFTVPCSGWVLALRMSTFTLPYFRFTSVRYFTVCVTYLAMPLKAERDKNWTYEKDYTTLYYKSTYFGLKCNYVNNWTFIFGSPAV